MPTDILKKNKDQYILGFEKIIMRAALNAGIRRQEDREDIVGDMFAIIAEDSFYEKLDEITADSYIYTLAFNRSRNYRRLGAYAKIAPVALEDLPDIEDELDRSFQSVENSAAVASLLNTCIAQQTHKTYFALWLSSYSLEEIIELTGCPSMVRLKSALETCKNAVARHLGVKRVPAWTRQAKPKENQPSDQDSDNLHEHIMGLIMLEDPSDQPPQ